MRPFLLATLILLAGCEPASSPAATEDASPTAMLHGLTIGDRACYLDVEDTAGAREEMMGEFEVCYDTSLVGRRVRLTYDDRSVQALSCQGDPECSESETARLVVAVEPAY